MPQRSRHALALAAAVCGLLAAACSAPAGAAAGISGAGSGVGISGAGTSAGLARTTTLTAGAAPALTAAAFPEPDSGWLLGQPGSGPARAEIWHTATAGRTWHLEWQGAGSPLDLSATDPAHAWALVACPQSRASCGRELIATTDGGLRWRVTATLPAAVNQVRFFSARLGLATSDRCLLDRWLTRCPGEILLSRDGGAHWTRVLAGPAPVFATASPGGQLWAAQTSPTAITFLTSTNGGRSWRVLGRATGLFLMTPEVQVSLAAQAAGSLGLAWAAVFDPLSCAMHGCAVADLLASADSGRSWRQVNLRDRYPDECAANGIVLSAAPDGSAWAATGRNGAACDAPWGLPYRHLPPGEDSAWQQLPPWQLAGISSLDAVSQNVAYAIGGQGALARTGDGGRHWTQLFPAPAPAGLLDVLGPGTALGAQDAVDAGAVLRSADGGRTWNEVADLPGVVTQLDFPDAGDGTKQGIPSAGDGVAASYLPGAASPWRLWRSRDGGRTWQAAGALPGGNSGIDGPWFSAAGRGLLLTVTGGLPWEPGSGGFPPVRVWTTADWGSTWSRGALLPLGRDTMDGPASFTPSGGLYGFSGWLVVAGANASQRVAVADGGPLRLLPAFLDAQDVQLLGCGTGFAWGQDSSGNPAVTVLSLFRTTDGGRSWRHSETRLAWPPSGQGQPLLAFGDASHGWLVLDGLTWRTADGGLVWSRG